MTRPTAIRRALPLALALGALALAPAATAEPQAIDPSGSAAPARVDGRDFGVPIVRYGRGVRAPIEASVARDADGCRYEARVTGSTRVYAPAFRGEPTRYHPRATVTAELACPGEARRAVTADVRGHGASHWRPERLEREIERRGAVTVARGGRVCTYAPDVAIGPGIVRAVGVTSSCAPSR